ncbi:hypothetical protein CYMTET_17384, partial [Cymbomonas tetramitiformis]
CHPDGSAQKGRTPLDVAAQNGHKDTAELQRFVILCGTKPAPADESGVDSDWAELTAEQKEEALDLCKALPDLCAEFPTVLRFTSKGKVGKASEAYAKMCATVDAVARDSLCQAIDLCQTINYEEVLDTLLSAAQHCTRSSLLGARLLGVQHCVQRLLLSAVRQGENVTQWQGPWQEVMAVIRQTCRERAAQARAAKAGKTVSMSNSLLDLYLTRVELTLTHLKAKDVVLSVGKSVGMLVIGAVKSVAMTRVDGMLLEGLQKTAGLALDAIRRSITHTCFAQLALIEQLAISADHCVSQDWTTLRDRLRRVHDQHFKLGSTGMWEPTAGRWEPKAAFTALLADLLVGVGGSSCSFHTLPSEDVKMICLGSGDFIGLIDLMSLGNDPRGRRDEEPSLILLAGWAQSLFANPTSLDEWLGEGLTLLASEVRRVGEERVDALLTEMTIKLVEQLEMAVQQLQNLCADSTHHHKRRQAKTALAALCQEAEAMRTAAQQVQASAKLALRVAERAKKLLHTVGGLSPKDVAMSALWTLTRRLQQYCAVPIADKVLHMDEGIVTAHLEATGAHLKTELEKVSLEMLQKREEMKLLQATMEEAAEQPELGRRWSEALHGLPILEEVAKEVQGAVCLRLRALQGEFRQGLALVQVCQALLKSCVAKAPCQGQAAPRVEELEALLRDKVAPRLQECVRCVQRAHDEKRSVDDDPQSTVIQGSILKAIMCLLAAEESRHREEGRNHDPDPAATAASGCEAIPGGEAGCEPAEGKVSSDVMKAVLLEMAPCFKLEELSQILNEGEVSVITELRKIEQFFEQSLSNASSSDFLLRPYVQHLSAYADTMCALLEEVRDHAGMADAAIERSLLSPFKSAHRVLASQPAESQLEEQLRLMEKARDSVKVALLLGADECPQVEGRCWTECAANPAVQDLHVHLAALSDLCAGLQGLVQTKLPALEGEDDAEKLKKWLGGEGNKAKDRAMDVARDLKVMAGEELERMAKAVGGEEAVEALSQAFAPMAGLVQEAARGLLASHSSEVWHVREVAAVSSLRVLSVPRLNVLEERERDTVCRTLQASVMRCLSFEQRPEVRAVLSGGDALARELNTLRQLPRGTHVDAKGEVEDVELAEEAAAEWRQEGWTAAQAEVEQQALAQLAELEELQAEAAQEPDELEKQRRVVRCRAILADVASASRNLRDLSANHRVVVGFLNHIDGRLEGIGTRLDVMQADVRALRGDMKRLLGRPVLEELKERRKRSIAEQCRLREGVYIPARGVHKGEDGRFEPHKDSNPTKDLLQEVRSKFLESDQYGVLLLSGPAGSGKTTFVQELALFLELEYAKRRQGDAARFGGGSRGGTDGDGAADAVGEELPPAILVKVLLPTLENPLTDLFAEALRRMDLREAQIHELRELAQDGKVRLVFLLDAYDELRPKHVFKNLYLTNNLEQYRPQTKSKEGDEGERQKPLLGYPKVIITTRTELLSRRADYLQAFVPKEMEVKGKSNSEEAFLELRIAPFNEQLETYIHAKVALEVRRAFESRVGPISPVSQEGAKQLCSMALKAWQVETGTPESSTSEMAAAAAETTRLLEAACQAVMVPGGLDEVGDQAEKRMRTIIPDDRIESGTPSGDGRRVTSVMAATMKDPPQELEKVLVKFRTLFEKSDGGGRVWFYRDYLTVLNTIPELKELTTTPFMVEIVTEILPGLQHLRTSDASIKAKLFLLLTEEAALAAWACIRQWREAPVGNADKLFREAQEAPDESAVLKEAHSERFKALSQNVGKHLAEQKLLLCQPELLKIAHDLRHARPRQGIDTPDDEVDEVLEDILEEVDEERTEQFIRADVVPFVLRSALQRERVCRNRIYAMFVDMFLQREARKAHISGAFDPETVLREGTEFARQLAIAMVSENVSKVPIGGGSQLFPRASVWDAFLREGNELLAVAQKVAPVRLDHAVLSFIHKTVQEHLCAVGLRDVLRQILRDLPVPLSQLAAQLASENLQGVDFSHSHGDMVGVTTTVVEKGLSRGTSHDVAKAKSQAETVVDACDTQHGKVPRPAGTGAPALSAPPSASSDARPAVIANIAKAEERAVTRALQKVDRLLRGSALAQVDLQLEDVLRDFLADIFIEEHEFMEELSFLAPWAERRCVGGRLAGTGGLGAGMLLGNVRAVLGGVLPKRSGGSLLHAAAADGSHIAVSTLLKLLRGGALDEALLEAVDDEGRTPLFCASQRGHVQVVAALRAAGAKHDARSKLQPSVRLISTAPFTVIPKSVFGLTGRDTHAGVDVNAQGNLMSIGCKDFCLNHGIIGAPAAVPPSGCWQYEVEVKLNWNMINSLCKDMQRIGLWGCCVGWSSRDARQMSWNHVTKRLEEVTSYDELTSWHEELGFHLGTNAWSCGLHSSGKWCGGSSVVLPSDGTHPQKADASIAWNCVIGMLLDCDARTVYASTGTEWVKHRVGNLGGRMFPAVSWMGCHGEVLFNFGERPWRCDVPTPGGVRFRPIREAGSGNTPVMEAASEGHLEVCSLLLDSAAAEDVGRRHQRTLLHWAAWWGDAVLARRVLEVGGDRDACMRAVDGDNCTAVCYAAEKGHAEVLRVLWQTSKRLQGISATDISSKTGGADFNHVALEGRTPAHLAAEGGFTQALRVLKEAGAAFSRADNNGMLPAHLAAAGGYAEALWEIVAQVLIMLSTEGGEGAGADLSHAANDGRTPAHWAAEDGEGRTALTVALALGLEAAARALLEAGAGVNAGTGQRPVHAAAKRGMEEVLRELAEKGAEVDAEDVEGRTALTVALAFGQEAAARALLEAGAGMNAGTGRRPLHAAAERGMVVMLSDSAQKVELVGSARAMTLQEGECFSAEILQLVQK